MSRRTIGPDRIAKLFDGRDQVLEQVAQGAAELKPFLRAWHVVVPNPASNFVRPAYYRDGRLTVWVHSPVWANWLRHRRGLIIERIRANKLPEVHSLTMQLVPEKRTGARPERDAPSPETGLSLERSARSIVDPELRASLERLARSLKNLHR